MLQELVELDRIRLDEDKSYGALAAEIGLKGQQAGSTLHRLLQGDRAPRDRTLHKIRNYLATRNGVVVETGGAS